ncbi:hypothetical protein MKZ38_007577 [Zalerion maritima]|uniref:Uncharacterized protein n=1 Tax=Zalerion maritima TaxID=339359 RepID=A0AAD5RWS2_9PEZI|nr:hypothetical protein MKZ38_007577 [Zalerion maritima]
MRGLTTTVRRFGGFDRKQFGFRRSHHGSFPALFVRGGTSNGLVIRADVLPAKTEWQPILARAMGSPDPFGRQLDGMGSGISSTSKICVIEPSGRQDADVDFTFVQVGVKDGVLDMAGNCGNLSSIVGPCAFDWGFLKNTDKAMTRTTDDGRILMRIFNTNTNKIIHSRFSTHGQPPRFQPGGDYEMDGVPARGSRITLSFLDPAGAKTGKALPTDLPIDVLSLADGTSIPASLVDVANPGVFVRVDDLGIENFASIGPEMIDADVQLRSRLEAIRQEGAVMMGLDPATESVPKIVLLFPEGTDPGVDIKCQAMSMGQPHKAVPLTLALCLGAAANIPGTLAAQLVKDRDLRGDGTVTIGHPSGQVDIGTTTTLDGRILSSDFHRTARVMMKGEVLY